MKTKSDSWFEVDRKGLARLVARRGKAVVVLELLQNAWDAPGTTKVDLDIAICGDGLAKLTVTDDSPQGFARLSDAWRLFAESDKVSNPEQRGRFNLGEKLVLALCEEATISSTTGTVSFGADGRREVSRKKLDTGSSFTAKIRLGERGVMQVLDQVMRCIPPSGIVTFVNGDQLSPRMPLSTCMERLQTEFAKPGEPLITMGRQVEVAFYPAPDREGWLYEMGIPIVSLDLPWDVNVNQKIPLTLERDNVRPGYLKRIRELALEHMHSHLQGEAVRAPWIATALSAAGPEAVRHVVRERFGDKAVIADPSDREGENIAKAQGYTVVSGGTFDAATWQAIREAGALKPAGQVTPSPKPFHPDGDPLELVPRDKWTLRMDRFAVWARKMYGLTVWPMQDPGIRAELTVEFTLDKGWKFGGAYGSHRLIVNVARLGGEAFLYSSLDRQKRTRFLIHEFAHEFGHHLEDGYHEALENLGARFVELALGQPSVFEIRDE